MEWCVFFWLSGTMRGPETARAAVHTTITAGVRSNEALAHWARRLPTDELLPAVTKSRFENVCKAAPLEVFGLPACAAWAGQAFTLMLRVFALSGLSGSRG